MSQVTSTDGSQEVDDESSPDDDGQLSRLPCRPRLAPSLPECRTPSPTPSAKARELEYELSEALERVTGQTDLVNQLWELSEEMSEAQAGLFHEIVMAGDRFACLRWQLYEDFKRLNGETLDVCDLVLHQLFEEIPTASGPLWPPMIPTHPSVTEVVSAHRALTSEMARLAGLSDAGVLFSSPIVGQNVGENGPGETIATSAGRWRLRDGLVSNLYLALLRRHRGDTRQPPPERNALDQEESLPPHAESSSLPASTDLVDHPEYEALWSPRREKWIYTRVHGRRRRGNRPCTYYEATDVPPMTLALFDDLPRVPRPNEGSGDALPSPSAVERNLHASDGCTSGPADNQPHDARGPLSDSASALHGNSMPTQDGQRVPPGQPSTCADDATVPRPTTLPAHWTTPQPRENISQPPAPEPDEDLMALRALQLSEQGSRAGTPPIRSPDSSQ